jgi:hypothetical protein
MKPTTIILLLTAVLLVHSTVIAADTNTNVPNARVQIAEETDGQTKLEMKVEIIVPKEEISTNQQGKRLYVEIRNVGKTTVLLPTKGLGPDSDGTAGGLWDLTFSPDWYLSTRDGFRIPKAKSDLAIVELRPKEAIVLDYEFVEPIPASVIVRYRISEETGERYGVWNGEITSEPINVK